MATESINRALEYLSKENVVPRHLGSAAGLRPDVVDHFGTAVDWASEINYQTTPHIDKETMRLNALLNEIGLDVGWFNHNFDLEITKERTNERAEGKTKTHKETFEDSSSAEISTPMIKLISAGLKSLVSRENKTESSEKDTGVIKQARKETEHIVNAESVDLMLRIREHLRLKPLNTLHKYEHHPIDLKEQDELKRLAASYTAIRIMASVLRAIAASTIFTEQREPNARHDAHDYGSTMRKISDALKDGDLQKATRDLALIQTEYPPSIEQEYIISKGQIDLAFHLALYAHVYEKVALSMEKNYIQYLKDEVLKTDQEINVNDTPGAIIKDDDAYSVVSVKSG